MALFSIICWDKPASMNLRMANRDKHLAYLEDSGNVRFAGPFLSETGNSMIGSHVMLECKTRDAAERWTDGDPYNQAGLFAQVEIHPWMHTFGGLNNK